MGIDYEGRIRECIATDSTLIGIGEVWEQVGMIELTDGSLLKLSKDGRSVSADGGRTWSGHERMCSVEGNQFNHVVRFLQRLKSGAIGGFIGAENNPRETQYGFTVSFVLSTDEGRTWSKPRPVSEPFNNVGLFGATTTHTGRIVTAVYTLVGKTMPEKGRALYGDEVARVGAHGYEHFFTYCWAYYSDDEGETWNTNEGKGKWGAGGELFVTLDHSAGGHWRANEPVVEEVSPDHLLMLLRTPLGRLFQSWSSDNGTTWSHPEPSSLASALAPADLKKIPDTNDLLVIWNQSSTDEIQRGLQRHRLSTAISKDGGTTWLRGRNIFSVHGEHDRVFVEPPPIGNYRAMELAPRLPTNDVQGTYPRVTFWQDKVIVKFVSFSRSNYVVPEPAEGRKQGGHGDVYITLPISWFYEDLSPFGNLEY